MRYLKILNEGDPDSVKDIISCISYLINHYNKKKDPQLLFFISSLIEIYYNDLSLKNSNNLNIYFNNKLKILQEINNAKKYNLDKRNLFMSLLQTLKNES